MKNELSREDKESNNNVSNCFTNKRNCDNKNENDFNNTNTASGCDNAIFKKDGENKFDYSCLKKYASYTNKPT